MLFSGLAVAANSIDNSTPGMHSLRTASVPQNSLISNYGVGLDPFGGTYDPYNQYIYITNSNSNNVTVVNSFTNRTVANIDVGVQPEGISYVPYNHDLYVNNFRSSNISIISSVSNSVVGSIKLAGNATFNAYDPQTASLYVTGQIGTTGVLWNISVLNNTVISMPSLPVGAYPTGLAFDPINGYMYVTDLANNCVYALTSSGNIAATIAVGQGPYDLAFDPANKMMYVTDQDTNGLVSGNPAEFNVTVINTINNAVVKTVVPGTEPTGIAYDPINGYIYVSNSVSNNVSVLNSITNTIIATLPGTGFAAAITAIYDPVLQQMVSIGDSGQLATMNFNSAGGSAQQFSSASSAPSVAFDPVNGYLYTATNGPSVNIYSANGTFLKSIPTAGGVYSVIYANNSIFATENTSPNGSIAIINPSNNTISKTLNLQSTAPDGLAYDSLNNTLFVAMQGNSVEVVSLSSYTVVQPKIPVGIGPNVLTYSNVTNQVYVAQNDENIHIINASSYVNIYPYSVAGSNPSQAVYDPYTNSIYIANSGNNSMFVINESKINYKVNQATPYYSVYLGAPQHGISLDTSNGLIYISQPTSSNVTIYNPLLNETVGEISSASVLSGAGPMTYLPTTQIILTAEPTGYPAEISPAYTYGVSVSVGNLVPSGTAWNLQIQPSADSALAKVYTSSQSGNQTAYIPLPNGSYTINVTVPGTNLAPIHSYFGVSSSPLKFLYYEHHDINFTETGLAAGTSWSVSLGGETLYSTTNTLTFSLNPGNYTAFINGTDSYEAYPSSLNVSNFNSNATVNVYFQSAQLQTYGAISRTIDVFSHYQRNYTGDSFVPINSNLISYFSAYDPSNGLLFMPVGGSSNEFIYVYNLSDGSTVDPGFLTGNNPLSAYFDTYNSMFYVACLNSGNSTLLSVYPSNGSVAFGVSLPGNVEYPIAATNTGVFVMNSSGTVFDINGTGSIVKEYNLGTDVYIATLIPYKENLYAINASGGLERLNLATSTVTNYSLPSGFGTQIAIQGEPGTLYITGYDNSSIQIFNESNDKFTGTITLSSQEGGKTIDGNNTAGGVYDPANGLMYFSSNSGSFAPSPSYYFVVNPVTDSTVTSFSGFYDSPSLSVIYTPSSQSIYSVSFFGAIISEISPQKFYNVTVREEGLPAGTSWTLKLSNGNSYTSTGTSITLYVENDTQYTYTISSGNSSYGGASGNLLFTNSTYMPTISFNLLKYTVSIKESGLSKGTAWSVEINGTTYNSTSDLITLQLPNGTYSYSVTSVGGYTLTNGTGNVSVSGGATVSITFAGKSSGLGLSTLDYAIIAVVVGAAAGGTAVYMVRMRARK